MATHQPLSLFPSIEQVEKRREDLDALIQKSMERPTRRFPSDVYMNAPKRAPSRSRTRTPAHDRDAPRIPERHEGRNVDQPRPLVDEHRQDIPTAQPEPLLFQEVTVEELGAQHSQLAYDMPRSHTSPPEEDFSMQQQQLMYEIPRSYTSPPEFNPHVMKTDPLPPPPLDIGLVRQISRSPAKRLPTRTASVRGGNRVSNGTTRSSTFSPVSSHQSSTFSAVIETPVTEGSVYSDYINTSLQNKLHESPGQHSIQYSTSLRRNLYGPSSRRPSQSNDSVSSFGNVRAPSRTSIASGNAGMAAPPREMSSRASHRTQGSYDYPIRYRVESSSESTDYSNPSTDSSRKNSLMTDPEDFYQLDRGYQPIKSIFPTYDHNLFVQQADPISEESAPIPQHTSPVLQHQTTPPMQQHGSPILQQGSPVIQQYTPSLQQGPPTQQIVHVAPPQVVVPIAHQSFYPSRPAPTPNTAPTPDVKTQECEPEQAVVPTRFDNLTLLRDLNALWDVSNGQITTHVPGVYNLKMYRPGVGKKRTRLMFGSSEDEIFYTLNHVRPPTDADEDFPHETLLFRHHAAALDELANQRSREAQQDDLLPIAHSQILPPPAPSMSRSNKNSYTSITQEAATHITTITPVLATLHALDHASKSPQAHKLALVDPKAESPAAARLAERAVKAASDRESCTLTWIRTCPQTGKYELHHPSLGVFTVIVEGNVKGAMDSSAPTRGPCSISIMNPFAQVSPTGSTPNGTGGMLSPSAFAFGVARGSGIGMPKPLSASSPDAALLARLDFDRNLLHLDVPAIQSLGNVYLLDVCVSTLLAVAVSESSRADDPGLVFAAPPTALTLANRTKSMRIFSSSSSKVAKANKSTVSLVVMPKQKKDRRGTLTTIDWTRTNAIMGIENLVDSTDLPRITRGILSVIGAAFKSCLWLLEFGVRISARMVIGLSRLAEKV